MAYEPLKPRHRQIEAGKAEMERYRRRFVTRLQAVGPSRMWRPGTFAAGAVAAVAMLVLLFQPPKTMSPEFPQKELAELQTLAEETPETLESRANAAISEGQPLDRLNALMLLSLSKTGEEAIRFAAQGVQEDHRADFRFFYLELLLDQADEYTFNQVRIEQLMEREASPECLRLYRRLLRIAI